MHVCGYRGVLSNYTVIPNMRAYTSVHPVSFAFSIDIERGYSRDFAPAYMHIHTLMTRMCPSPYQKRIDRMQVMYMPIFIASYNVCKILYSFGPPKCRGRPCRSDTHACIHACVNICILIARTQVRRLALPGQSVNFVWGLHNLQVPRTGVWSCLLSSYQCICMDSVCGIQPCDT